ncbi:putative porin [Flavobacterium branchiophilum]|uniref:Beta-barrel porin n=1 Tax=Flavobacterium branchiophilum (strain FL-15) TaxID=1034807 RepID=G2Z321_FLABF|nr:putative porin [Flavobacterium branchiophilum]CCB70361.1 Protein of unknown function [Flavobacterium branchiophilum FL-15]
MKKILIIVFLLFPIWIFSQTDLNEKSPSGSRKSLIINHDNDKPKAKIDQYRIISLQKDTTYLDTSLTIKSLYKFNFLRKDIFGLLPFANEGQTYNSLTFNAAPTSVLPEIGFNAKQFNFVSAQKVKYYSVATPLTDLYFKTVMEQGQTVEALIAINTSERLNFSVGFKGLRSLGKYINQLSSTGNFVFTTSYKTKNNRYVAHAHFTGQDFTNGENGGITTLTDFTSGSDDFKNRARLNVYLTDAKTILKGKRFFLDHTFNLVNQKDITLALHHQVNYENKFYNYNQATVPSTIGNSSVNRFGTSYLSHNINDDTNYNKLYNQVGLVFESNKIGKINVFIDDFRDNSYYNKILIINGNTISSVLKHKINSIGGQYSFKKNQWSGYFKFSNDMSQQRTSNTEGQLQYQLKDQNYLAVKIQNINKIPDNTYNLFQSSYLSYNWSNQFQNEKTKNLSLVAKTKWVDAQLQASILNDHLYFSNDSISSQIISPKQFQGTIQYYSLKLSRELKYKKWALDNTIMFQEVNQDQKILNLPSIITRNSLYFSDYYFKKALFLQTGVTVNYFSKYYANDYNPVVSEFFVQKQTKIGGYPNLDFFINGRIRQTRIFLIAEHFNASFSGYNYLTAPNYPYRDFMVRFGLVWNFFQ